MIAVLAWHV